MNDILLFFKWWADHTNMFPFILDHWLLTWTVSLIVSSYLAGRWGMTHGGDDEFFGLIFTILALPLLLAFFLMVIPVIAVFAVVITMMVGLFNLGDKSRRR